MEDAWKNSNLGIWRSEITTPCACSGATMLLWYTECIQERDQTSLVTASRDMFCRSVCRVEYSLHRPWTRHEELAVLFPLIHNVMDAMRAAPKTR